MRQWTPIEVDMSDLPCWPVQKWPSCWGSRSPRSTQPSLSMHTRSRLYYVAPCCPQAVATRAGPPQLARAQAAPSPLLPVPRHRDHLVHRRTPQSIKPWAGRSALLLPLMRSVAPPVAVQAEDDMSDRTTAEMISSTIYECDASFAAQVPTSPAQSAPSLFSLQNVFYLRAYVPRPHAPVSFRRRIPIAQNA